MKIGIGLLKPIPDARGPELIQWAERAERAAFSSLATIDRILYPSCERVRPDHRRGRPSGQAGRGRALSRSATSRRSRSATGVPRRARFAIPLTGHPPGDAESW
jgi:hypothetical protein